ncbi:hypothetical protein F4560_003602 [Saccharothrix ecbatanensis]|jgi:hypothetical protein|uniref:Uncharacterized protein n=1 Tax=Saccharothrix ecbatanensis TaxID=1105145 RepID=A0A7W9M1C6_9PSEU|nr:hypothetical protein [Saccharothrix ecbatanensis]MBB5803834.1 hypothetical protein [Saccharothrix ecbatanensis]
MRKIATFGLTGLSLLATVALIAPAASAAGTTIRSDSATGAAYSGNVRGTLISSTVRFASSAGNATCNRSTLTASVRSDGTALSVSALSFSDSSSTNGSCPNDQGGRTTIAPATLPWSGGNVTYAPVAGGRDGTITLTNVSARVDSSNWLGVRITCYFVGSGANNSITGNLYNKDNANRPVTSVADAQASLSGASLRLTSGSSPCPTTATLTGAYRLLGESAAGSGTFNRALYVTG